MIRDDDNDDSNCNSDDDNAGGDYGTAGNGAMNAIVFSTYGSACRYLQGKVRTYTIIDIPYKHTYKYIHPYIHIYIPIHTSTNL